MRRIVMLFPGAIGVVCAAYTGIYLVRWEWNRAIISGLFFVAAEVIVASLLVLDRLRRTEDRILTAVEAQGRPTAPDLGRLEPDPATLDALRSTAPEPPDRFAWIRDRSGSMNVFLPVLLGAGVIASALAWLVEHLARATVSPAMERRLARQLHVLAVPAGGLLGRATDPPIGRRRSWPVRIVVGVLVVALGALTAVSIDWVADRTQTRPDVRDPQAQTAVELQLYGEIADRNPERVLDHLWSVCTGPDVFRSTELPPPAIAHLPGGLIRVVVDTDVGQNGEERLRGCLNDTTLDKVRARVVSLTIS